MTPYFSGLLIIAAVALLWIGFRVVSHSDPFSFVSILLPTLVFSLVIRPFTLVSVEGRAGKHIEVVTSDLDLYVFVTLLAEVITYACILVGFSLYANRLWADAESRHPIELERYQYIGYVFFALGVGGWAYLMIEGGGVTRVLASLGDRTSLFMVGGGTHVFELTKSFLVTGTVLLACCYFLKARLMAGWIVTAMGFLVMLTFGGRGNAFNVLMSSVICQHYLYRRVRVKYVVVAIMVLIPVAMILHQLRGAATAESAVDALTAVGDGTVADRLIDLTYTLDGFNYGVAFFYKNVHDGLSYFGQYFLGVTMLLPRSIYPEKANILGSRLAGAIYGIEGYGIGQTIAMGIVAYWGYIGLPLVALFIGVCGAHFWRKYALGNAGDPFRILIYIRLGLLVPFMLTDFAWFVSEFVPRAVTLIMVRWVYQTRLA